MMLGRLDILNAFLTQDIFDLWYNPVTSWGPSVIENPNWDDQDSYPSNATLQAAWTWANRPTSLNYIDCAMN